MGVHGRLRSGRAPLVRVVGPDQRRAHGEAVQEVHAARALGRAHGAVPARVQTAQGQPEALPGTDPGGGHRGADARRVLRGRRGDAVRRAAVHPPQGQVITGDSRVFVVRTRTRSARITSA